MWNLHEKYLNVIKGRRYGSNIGIKISTKKYAIVEAWVEEEFVSCNGSLSTLGTLKKVQNVLPKS